MDATSKASPTLASQAEKVSRVIGRMVIVVVWVVCIKVVVARKRVNSMLSIHNRAEIRCVRYIVIPSMLKVKEDNSVNCMRVI